MIKINCDNIDRLFDCESNEAGVFILDKLLQPFCYNKLKKIKLLHEFGYAIIIQELSDVKQNDGCYYLDGINEAQVQIENYLIEHGLCCISFNVDRKKRLIEISASEETDKSIYVCKSRKCISIDWDVVNLYKKTDLGQLNINYTAHAIQNTDTFSDQTYFNNIRFLLPGCTIKIDNNDLRSYSFISKKVVRAKEWIHSNLDVTEAALEALSQKIPIELKNNNVGCELSGGLDSALVAALLKFSGINFGTYGILLSGEEAKRQEYKRSLILKNICTKDKTVHIDNFMPLNNMNGYFLNNKKIWPKSEIYADALNHLAIMCRNEGAEVIFTGIGGDELTKITKSEAKYLKKANPSVENPIFSLLHDNVAHEIEKISSPYKNESIPA
jgi:hypothetical protein